MVTAVDERGQAPTTFLRAAVRPRMLVLLLALLAAAAVCARLGVWQLDRAQVRGAAAEQRHAAEQESAAPEPLGDVLAPQTSFRGDLVGRKVVVSGTYDPAGQLLVPGREHDGRLGLLVLTPLHVTPGTEGTGPGGAVLPVVRGWAADEAAVDRPPAGTVDVVGYLQVAEQAGPGVVDGRTDAISSAELLGVWGGPIYTGYLVVSGSDPAQSPDLALLDPPSAQGAGLNVQNLAYAAQWWIFGGFALALWLRLVRDEARGEGLRGDDEVGAPAGAD